MKSSRKPGLLLAHDDQFDDAHLAELEATAHDFTLTPEEEAHLADMIWRITHDPEEERRAVERVLQLQKDEDV